VPNVLVVAYAAVLGLAIGSFLNVVIWRVPRGESVLRPPSACPLCGHRIRARDNVPILGWLLLRGRCRDCHNPISVRYPLVEAATGVLFAAIAARSGLDWELPAYLYFAALGLALALIDLDTKRLPDVLTKSAWLVTAALLGLAAALGHHPGALLRATVAAAAVGTFYFLVWFLYPAGMGFGDVKLAPTVGAFLGWISYGVTVTGVFLGFVYGAVIGIAFMALGKAGRKSKVPFGPFIVAGALTGIFVGQRLADAYVSVTLG
jgi:leader peptidase (prepilin peptidase)/N-methyltransferase